MEKIIVASILFLSPSPVAGYGPAAEGGIYTVGKNKHGECCASSSRFVTSNGGSRACCYCPQSKILPSGSRGRSRRSGVFQLLPDTSSADSEFDEEGWSPPPVDDAALDFSVFYFDLPGTSSRAGGCYQSSSSTGEGAVERLNRLPHSVRRMDTISSALAAIASLTLPPTPPPLCIVPSTSGADRLGEDHRLVEIRLCELLAEIEQIKETISSLDGRVAQLEHKLEETCKDL
uniref:Uncharacterized protein n=1 Tax=Oryza glumipatula TaxID=40148 RepID=A0A0E0AS87_9ORYZ